MIRFIVSMNFRLQRDNICNIYIVYYVFSMFVNLLIYFIGICINDRVYLNSCSANIVGLPINNIV